VHWLNELLEKCLFGTKLLGWCLSAIVKRICKQPLDICNAPKITLQPYAWAGAIGVNQKFSKSKISW